jgi:hypothetical protein
MARVRCIPLAVGTASLEILTVLQQRFGIHFSLHPQGYLEGDSVALVDTRLGAE